MTNNETHSEAVNVLLIPGDEQVVEQVREMLSHAGDVPFTIVTADNMAKGLELAAQEHFDVMLLDDAASGESLLDHLARVRDGSPDLPVVILSELPDENAATRLIRAGAQDYLVKSALSVGRLRRSLRFAVNRSFVLKALRQSQVLLEREIEGTSKMLEDESFELDGMTHDLNAAARIQTHLLPRRMPGIEGYDIAAHYQPSKIVGGDYYDLVPVGDGHTGLVIADVSGKSITGLVGTMLFRSLLYIHARRSVTARTPLMAINRQIADHLRPGMFITSLYAVLHHESGRLRVCRAGHEPLIHWKEKTGTCRIIQPSGVMIGFDRGQTFDPSLHESRLMLSRGDRIVLYTDGIPEARDAEGNMFGRERLFDLVKEHAEESSQTFIHRITEAVDNFRAGIPLPDDLTILTVRCTR